MEKLFLTAKTHLTSNWQGSWEDTLFLKRLVKHGGFSFQKRSATIVSTLCCNFLFPHPSYFPIAGFKVLSITSAFHHLKVLVYARCTIGTCHLPLLSPAPGQYGTLLEAWSSLLGRGFWKKITCLCYHPKCTLGCVKSFECVAMALPAVL